MVSNTNPILYACVSREGSILANAGSGVEDLQTLAAQCLEKTPPFHRLYSHTAGKKTYSFVIEDPFVYFAICDEGLGKPPGLRFLERVKNAFLKSFRDRQCDGRLRSRAFQEEFGPVLRYLMQMQLSETPQPSVKDAAETDDRTTNSSSVHVLCTEAPLLGRAIKYEKISRPFRTVEHSRSGDFAAYGQAEVATVCNASRECRYNAEKSGCCGRVGQSEHARKLWRRHVRIVLFIDFVVCLILFGVWMAICKGFKCISQ